MYQLIVADYDGTLVPNGKVLSNEFYTKVNMLVSRGTLFAVASGRPYNQLKKLLYPIANETVFIASDGAQMMYRNCLLYKLPLAVNNAKALCRAALYDGLTPIVALREENRSVTEEKLDLPFFFSSDVFKLVVVKNGKDVSHLKSLAEENNARVCYEDETYIELCNKTSNKGEALKKLMSKYSVSTDKMIVFGDGINDIPMLELTENRFAPRNASADVKRIAVETGDIEEYIVKRL